MKFFKTLLIITLLLIPSITFADIGPKPTMEFDFSFNVNEQVDVIDGQLLECEDSQCNKSAPLQELGPQGFSCKENSCKALSYGFSPYHKLIINFTDKQRESKIFEHRGFNSVFSVSVEQDKLFITETTPIAQYDWYKLFFAVLLTLVVELLVAFAYARITKTKLKLLFAVLLANIITLPLMWFVYPFFEALPYSYYWFELIVIIIESIFIFKMNKEIITKKNAITLAVFMNVISILVGNYLGM